VKLTVVEDILAATDQRHQVDIILLDLVKLLTQYHIKDY